MYIIYKISELIDEINANIKPKFLNIYVTGEIFQINKDARGNQYLTLKDEESMIECFISKQAIQPQYELNVGTTIGLQGTVEIYKQRGKLTLNINKYKIIDNEGKLKQKFAELRHKLAQEGYFDTKYKKPIPKYVFDLGIITSEIGRAIEDIKKTISKRCPIVKITIYPCIVQGPFAPNAIIAQLKNADNKHDCLILARGGGSYEDLWCFNDENIVKTIFSLNTPIITGIGHEEDESLSDLVADYKCSTPTAAATYATFDYQDTKKSVVDNQYRLLKQIQNIINIKKHELNKYRNHRFLMNPQLYIVDKRQKLVQHQQKIIHYNQTLNEYKKNVQNNYHLLNNYFNKILLYHQSQLSESEQNIINLMKTKYQFHHQKFLAHTTMLNALSPLKTMSKGYSIALKDNEIVKSSKAINKNDILNLKLSDGEITTIVKEVKHDK